MSISSKPQVNIHMVRVDEEIAVVTYTLSNPSTTKSYIVEIKAEEYVHADFVVGPTCTGQLDMIIAHEDLAAFHAEVYDIDNHNDDVDDALLRVMESLKC